MFNNLSIKERLFSEENIYLAIYSVESYISNKELLDIKDKKSLIKLRDKFDWKNIEEWINKVKIRLDEIINREQYLKAKVFFKPKKYDAEVIFRPLHSASLLDQITAVSMLNILIYEFDENDKMKRSNLSRLIPHNFYGNRVAYEPERLFKPWQEQYKEYTSTANEFYRKYHDNLEYKWEISLDIENFFPSINPISLINFINQQMSVEYSSEECLLINKILEKLIFNELIDMPKEDVKRYTGYSDIDESQFTIGLPQGLPQSYFLANLFMIKLQEIYEEVIPGEMLFYVDDSVIFTNEIDGINDFEEKINLINRKIEIWMKSLREYDDKVNLSEDVKWFVAEKEGLFHVHIHEPGDKSSISNVIDSKEGEIYIHCIGRETSKAAFDLNTSYSDEETQILLNKTGEVLQVINLEQNRNEKLLNGDEVDEDDKKYLQSYKKKLIRYKKFFKYRNKDLNFRKNVSILSAKRELLKDFEFLDRPDKEEGLKEFFDKYNDDTLGVNITFVLKAIKEANEDFSEIVDRLVRLNQVLFGKINNETSYLYTAYKEYIENISTDELEVLDMTVRQYTKLAEYIRRKKRYIDKKTDEVRTEEAIKLLKSVNDKFLVEGNEGIKFVKAVSLIISNSDTLQRMVLNALFSCLLEFDISDEVVLQKTNNRKINYFELRLLEILRNKNFSMKNSLN